MILQMISMGLPDVWLYIFPCFFFGKNLTIIIFIKARLFPFIEPPSGDAVENSLTALKVSIF